MSCQAAAAARHASVDMSKAVSKNVPSHLCMHAMLLQSCMPCDPSDIHVETMHMPVFPVCRWLA
jgi:hypothetical protein